VRPRPGVAALAQAVRLDPTEHAGRPTPPMTTGSEVVQIVPTVLLALLVIFVMPVWPHSRGWGWPPAGILAMGLATLVLFSLTVVPE
jgi:hypothetical protein